MKRKIFSILFALVLVVSFSLVTATPAAAAGIFIVGPNQYTSIQKAIDDATSGATIIVEAATYTENINVYKHVKIIGAGSGTDGTVITQTAAGAGDSKIGVVQLNASGNSDVDPLLFQNLRIEPDGMAGFSVGRFLEATGTSVSYLELDNVKVVGNNLTPATEQERGFYVDLTSTVNNLVVSNCSFDNLTYGWYLQKEVSADASTVQNVVVTGTTFNHNNLKGIYAEKLSDVTFTNCTASENGFWSIPLPPGAGDFLTWMCGIDINLKAGAYQNITFTDCTVTDNALGGDAKEGVGLTVKGRGTGTNPSSSYTTYPANVDNVQIIGGTFTGNERGIRFGEPGKGNATPTNVSVSQANISGNVQTYSGSDGSTYGGLINMTTVEVNAENNWWGSASGPTHDSNTYTAPTDDPQGNAVSDLVDFVPWLGGLGGGPVIPVTLDTPSGQYSSIQAAVIAASGTTITCIAGTYTEDVDINKSLQLLGAKFGVPAGPDASPAGRSDPLEESIIDGRIVITGAGETVVDGFTILSGDLHGITLEDGDVAINNIIVGSGTYPKWHGGIWSGGSGGHLIANNNIRNYQQGIFFDGNVVPQVTVTENYITGSGSTGIMMMASFCKGHVITNNLIEGNSSGMVFAQGEHEISGNRILNNDGSGIYIWGTPETYGIQITRNTIEGNGSSIYLDNDDSGAINNVAHFNNIVDNGSGLYNGHSAVFDATLNWWGDVTGPKQATTNPDGKGDKVSDNVSYIPWLTRHFETVLTEGIGYYGYPMVELGTGWNLLSTPFALDPGETIGEVTYPGCNTWAQFVTLNELSGKLYTGGDQEYVNAYYFDGEDQDWGEVTGDYVLLPCDAIYVRMASPDIAAVLASPQRWMPTKTLYEDWNLVGLSWMLAEQASVGEALNTVVEVGSLTGYTLVVSPWANQQPWTYAGGPPPQFMQLTKGYWVFMENGPDDLAGSWFTPMGLP